ncbi:MAG: ATP-binding protein [Thermoprotei archaeon]|nr:ATP-binding protein [Thermoprotei archaeon]
MEGRLDLNLLGSARLIGVVISGSRASLAPVRVSIDSIDFVRDEMLVLIEDSEEGRLYLGVVKGAVKKDIAIDGSSLPSNFDPKMSYSYSAPIMSAYVEIMGEISGGGVEVSFSIPRPGSRVYVVSDGRELSRLLGAPEGLYVGYHKFSGASIRMVPEALNYHVAVLGATGTGKSRLVKGLVEEVLSRTSYSVIIFDHTGLDYSDLSRWGFEASLVDGSRIILDPDVVSEIIIDRAGLKDYHSDSMYFAVTSYIQSRLEELQKGDSLRVKPKAEVSVEDIVRRYREACKNGTFKWELTSFIESLYSKLPDIGVRESTIRKYEVLITLRLGRGFFDNYLNGRTIAVDDIVGQVLGGGRLVIVDLSREVEYEAKRSIVYQVLKGVWDRVLAGRFRANAIAVIDEAHNYVCAQTCKPSVDMVARTAREGRKWGFGLILASQRVIDLAPDIRGNVNTIFFSRLQSTMDYEELKRWVEGVQFLEYTLPMLTRREFYFTGLGNIVRRPLLVRVKDVS